MYLVLFCSTCSIQLDIQSDSRIFSIHVTPNMSNLLFLDSVGSIFHLLLKLSLKWALLACSLCSISLRNLSILSIFSSCILIVFVKKSSCFLYNCMQIILSFSTFCLWHRGTAHFRIKIFLHLLLKLSLKRALHLCPIRMLVWCLPLFRTHHDCQL